MRFYIIILNTDKRIATEYSLRPLLMIYSTIIISNYLSILVIELMRNNLFETNDAQLHICDSQHQPLFMLWFGNDFSLSFIRSRVI